MENIKIHEVVITAIVVKDGKFLVMQRDPNDNRFPGMWTVPGGKFESDDFTTLPKETEHYWYNVLERTLAREVKEEVGLEIDNVQYLTSLATIHRDGPSSIVISCTADYKSGEIKLREGKSVDSKWVDLAEAKELDLIDGIYDELAMANQKRSGKKVEWQRFS